MIPGGFEAAAGSRRLRNFQPSRLHINALIKASGKDITARARHLVRNNGYAAQAVEVFTAASVGAGIIPRVTTGSAAFRRRVQQLWLDWTDESDAEGITDFYGQQRRVAREHFVAGEAFIRFRSRRPGDGLTVPLQLQILPSELLPVGPALTGNGGGTIRQGIEFDGIGRRTAYHFYSRHPDDTTDEGTALSQRATPAGEVVHVMDPMDGGQIRGVSRYAPAIVKLFLLDAYDDAELDRKKTAAMYAGFITRPPPDTAPFDLAETTDMESGRRSIDLEPGMMADLEPGEDIKFSAPADVGQSYEPFQYRTLLQIFSALGVPYASGSGDMVRANYGNTRAARIDFKQRIEAFQHAVLVFQMNRAVWRKWCDIAVLSGALVLEEGVSLDALKRRVQWLTPRWEWLDPLKDANAEKVQIDAGLKSRTQSVAERGFDIEELDAEIAAERQSAAARGLQFANASSAPPPPDDPVPADLTTQKE